MSKSDILKLIHSTPEHYNPPNKYRRKLMRTLPIASREITALDLRLANRPTDASSRLGRYFISKHLRPVGAV
jgi:hypothetical protein